MDYTCPICNKSFSAGKHPETNLRNHISRSVDARHVEYSKARKEEKARNAKDLDRMRTAERARRYRKQQEARAKLIAAAEEHQVADFRAYDISRLNSKRSKLRRKFTRQIQDLQPPVPPELPQKQLPPLFNPYFLLQYGVGIYPYGKQNWKSWKQFYEARIELIAPGTSVPQVYTLYLIYHSLYKFKSLYFISYCRGLEHLLENKALNTDQSF
jgi:hypothetical protein